MSSNIIKSSSPLENVNLEDFNIVMMINDHAPVIIKTIDKELMEMEKKISALKKRKDTLEKLLNFTKEL